MELIKCDTHRAKISIDTCRIRKEKAVKVGHHDNALGYSSETFWSCLECDLDSKKRVEVDVGEIRKKYTMSEAALRQRRDSSISSGKKRSRKISKDNIPPPSKEIPACSACGIRCTDADTFDIKAGMCGECMGTAVRLLACREKGNPTPAKGEISLIIDFSSYPDVYDRLLDAAKTDMRTPEMQVVYILSHE